MAQDDTIQVRFPDGTLSPPYPRALAESPDFAATVRRDWDQIQRQGDPMRGLSNAAGISEQPSFGSELSRRITSGEDARDTFAFLGTEVGAKLGSALDSLRRTLGIPEGSGVSSTASSLQQGMTRDDVQNAASTALRGAGLVATGAPGRAARIGVPALLNTIADIGEGMHPAEAAVMETILGIPGTGGVSARSAARVAGAFTGPMSTAKAQGPKVWNRWLDAFEREAGRRSPLIPGGRLKTWEARRDETWKAIQARLAQLDDSGARVDLPRAFTEGATQHLQPVGERSTLFHKTRMRTLDDTAEIVSDAMLRDQNLPDQVRAQQLSDIADYLQQAWKDPSHNVTVPPMVDLAVSGQATRRAAPNPFEVKPSVAYGRLSQMRQDVANEIRHRASGGAPHLFSDPALPHDLYRSGRDRLRAIDPPDPNALGESLGELMGQYGDIRAIGEWNAARRQDPAFLAMRAGLGGAVGAALFPQHAAKTGLLATIALEPSVMHTLLRTVPNVVSKSIHPALRGVQFGNTALREPE